jgi:hypothetical protein
MTFGIQPNKGPIKPTNTGNSSTIKLGTTTIGDFEFHQQENQRK